MILTYPLTVATVTGSAVVFTVLPLFTCKCKRKSILVAPIFCIVVCPTATLHSAHSFIYQAALKK